MASRVLKRTALARPFFRTAMLAGVRPTRLGELADAEFAAGQFDVDPDDDRHQITASMSVRRVVARCRRALSTSISRAMTVMTTSTSMRSIGRPGSSAWKPTQRKIAPTTSQTPVMAPMIRFTQKTAAVVKMRSAFDHGQELPGRDHDDLHAEHYERGDEGGGPAQVGVFGIIWAWCRN